MPPLPREVAVLDESDLRPLIHDTRSVDIVATGKGTSPGASRALLVLTAVAGIGGFLFGYDTGVISGALPYVRDDLLRQHAGDAARLAWLQEVIVSAAIVAAGVGSALGGALSDVAGRKRALLLADVLFTLGALGMGLAWDVGVLIAGRALVGLGVGLASVTVPVYIAECAPPAVRAGLVSANVLMITGGQFLAYVVDFFFSFVPGTWRWMLGVAALPSLAQAIGLLALPESPKWLASRGRAAEAQRALAKLQPGHSAATVVVAAAAVASGARGPALAVVGQVAAAAADAAGARIAVGKHRVAGPDGNSKAGGAAHLLSRRQRGASLSGDDDEDDGGGGSGETNQPGRLQPGSPVGDISRGGSRAAAASKDPDREPLWQRDGSGELLLASHAAQLAQHGQQQASSSGASSSSCGDRRWGERRRRAAATWGLLRSRPVIRQLHIGVGLQVLQQLCGINTVMYYTPAILELAGFHNKQTALLWALLPAGVNALGTVVGMFCIDRQGAEVAVRRRTLCLMAFFSAAGTGVGMFCIDRQADLAVGCGFCGNERGDLLQPGQCLALTPEVEEQCSPGSGKMLYRFGCPSSYTSLILIGLMAYLAAFSPGLGPVPWAVNAEIYPLQVRGLAAGLAATSNWITNAAVAQTFLTLTQRLGGSGAFWLYAAISGVGLLWTWWFLPETNGLTLDQIQVLFTQRAAKSRESDGTETDMLA
ncbi:hypothetical protein N2152v2_003050 [Parachlorella kessleri]